MEENKGRRDRGRRRVLRRKVPYRSCSPGLNGFIRQKSCRRRACSGLVGDELGQDRTIVHLIICNMVSFYTTLYLCSFFGSFGVLGFRL
ncbi:unnamed protein product [Linum tenue]|uniref:Transmembrane protein n=1 Tax=Linum tenue TaxID=586396 RepID=A0AAV0R6A6_9ROSI|nr:unnamed protein product [Linum tenue]